MRHPHGLRAAAKVITELSIGDSYLGGYFAGYISHTANGIATHGLIVAPKASGYYFGGSSDLSWKTADTTTSGTTSGFDGLANSNAMNNASHPAAQYCRQLNVNGYTDWYLPARYELDIFYHNLKPTTDSNAITSGINDYSVPKRTANRTAGTPAQTSVSIFQSGGSEAGNVLNAHLTSTEGSTTGAWAVVLLSGLHGTVIKTTGGKVRAFRKFAL